MIKRNPLSDHEKRLNELARKYETQCAQGESVYMEPEQFADLCTWYTNNYELEKADEVMDYALKLFPDNTMLNIEQAYRFIDKGDIDTAELLADQIDDDLSGDLQLLKARLMIEHEDFEEADTYLNSFPSDYFDPILVANMFLETHFSEKAINWLEKHGQGMEEEEDYLSILVNAYCYLSRYQEAIEACEKLIDKDPFSAHYWLSLARCRLAIGEYNKALDACDFSITNDEDFGEAYLTRGNLYVLIGNEKRAKENFREATRLHAIVPGDMNEFDLALLLDQNRAEDAIRLMEFYLKNIKLTEEQELNTHFRLGVCYGEMRWNKQAIAYFDKVLAKRPQAVEVFIQEATMFVLQDNFEEGLKYLKKAIEIEPNRIYLYRAMAIIALVMKRYDEFREYSKLSDEPLTDSEIGESISMVEKGDSTAINYLLDGLRKNIGFC